MTLIKCDNVKIGYGQHHVLNTVNLEIKNGDFICVLGNNGTGKTTLLKTLLRLIPQVSGRITYDHQVKYTMGYLPQDLNVNNSFPATVYEIILSGCLSKMNYRSFYGKKEKELANTYMEALGIQHLKKFPFKKLSGGQQQRVLIARALCSTDKIIFLDEPLQGLDHTSSAQLYDILSNINNNFNVTIVMITHNPQNALKHANKIVYLGHNESFVGTPEEYLQTKFALEYSGGEDHA